ncbi:multiple epidermal growth factor-like domains protein 10 [Crassostrea angulata]|uniref:multiple epidermal growth factor-like domains protein 10 n=1 Tax=Magallana angulata TaxID=2784310 RepID=UPI0022B169F6|nr:multiple epidermal growth factor-like domains protein 10 [Crassostrea angulata]
MESIIIQMLVILATVVSINTQCLEGGYCTCHCLIGCRVCATCDTGWSGSKKNYCQRQNVAYNATAILSSNFENNVAMNAVDEDTDTYALTRTEKNPQLIITLSNLFTIKRMYSVIQEDRFTMFSAYVTNSTQRTLTDVNMCDRFSATSYKNYRNITCTDTLTGDQIVITANSTLGRLVVYEIQVYVCSQGTYGDQCDSECRNCVDNRCDGYTGACESGCIIGWQGATCETKCNTNCLQNKCDQNTGFCTVGCSAGWFGNTCNRQCPMQCVLSCDRSLGCTNCQTGYNGSNCDPCDGNTYGKNCSLTCKNCNDCNSIDGCRECMNGYYGDLCDLSCPIENCEKCNLLLSGFSCEICKIGYYQDNAQEFQKCVKCPSRCVSCVSDLRCTQCLPKLSGNQCENECNMNCVDGLCEFDGTCTYGCNNSRYGVGCTVNCRENCVHCFTGNDCTKCLPGYWGKYCTGICYKNCLNCTSMFECEICKPGFYGSWCNDDCLPRCLTCDSGDSCSSCRDGWSGRLCQCSKNCKNEDCDSDGICQSGCNGLYYGERCDISCPLKNCQRCDQMSGNCTQCAKGLYGMNCSVQCSGLCLERTCDMTGACLQGCEDGFAGKFCTECKY